MKVYESCGLDNTVCEDAYKQGYTHIQVDKKIVKIVESDLYGFDWVEEGNIDE